MGEEGAGRDGGPQRAAPGWAYALLFVAVCAASSAASAFSFIRDVPPLTLAGWRLQLTSALLALLAAPQWRALEPELRARFRRDLGWSLASGAALSVHFGAWVWSLQHTSMAHAMLLATLTPVVSVSVAVACRQSISVGEVAGVLLAVGGAAVLALGAAVGKEAEASLVGDAAAFCAAVAVVGHWTVGKRLRSYQPVFVYSAPATSLAAMLLTIAGLVAEEGSLIGDNRHGAFGWAASRRYAPVVVYLAVFPGIIGHQGFNTVLKFLDPVLVALGVQLEPVIGPLLGWALGLAAAPGPYTWAGGAVVLVATAGGTLATARRQRREERELVKHKSAALPPEGDGDDEEAAAGAGGGGGGGGAAAAGEHERLLPLPAPRSDAPAFVLHEDEEIEGAALVELVHHRHHHHGREGNGGGT